MRVIVYLSEKKGSKDKRNLKSMMETLVNRGRLDVKRSDSFIFREIAGSVCEELATSNRANIYLLIEAGADHSAFFEGYCHEFHIPHKRVYFPD